MIELTSQTHLVIAATNNNSSNDTPLSGWISVAGGQKPEN
jgi:hypothetical protein